MYIIFFKDVEVFDFFKKYNNAFDVNVYNFFALRLCGMLKLFLVNALFELINNAFSKSTNTCELNSGHFQFFNNKLSTRFNH